MDLTLSTSNIILLTKLEAAVRREYGQRFVLSNDSSLWNLLKLAAESTNQAIQLAFFQFLECLDPAEKEKLIYRGIVCRSIEKDSEPSRSFAPSKVIYRGQEVAHTTTQPSSSATAENPADTPVASTKSKRIYRGRVIED